MSQNNLVVEVRERAGKGVARKLRQAGRVPAVLYGRNMKTVSLTLDPRRLDRLIHESDAGMNTLIDLDAEGDAGIGGKVVLVKEIQREPLKGMIQHVDLYEVDMSQSIEVSVPIHVVGEPIGVTLEGGILDHGLRELRIACLPRSIPEAFEVDVSALGIGDSLHVRDIPLPHGVELREDPDTSAVSVVAPTKVEEVVAAPEEEAEEAAAEAGPEGEPTASAGDESSESSSD